MRILIVEDDPVSALLLRKVLEAKGYLIDRADNGLEALAMTADGRYRVVISDWMMPEMDGVELCRQFRSREGSYLYTILLSAKTQREDRLAAFEAGVDDFLTKPLDREELFARLKVARRILDSEENLQHQKWELETATQRLQVANSNLMLASRRFEGLFNGLPVACFTFDAQGLIHEWNLEAEQMFGIPSHETLLKPVPEVFHEPGSFWTPELVAEIFSGRSMAGAEWTFRGDLPAPRWLVCNTFPLLGATGEPVGAICANLDITERKLAARQIEEQMAEIAQQQRELQEANARLELLAITDGLTGLWNHRRFQEALDLKFYELRRLRKPMSVVMIDVDHFKQFNDTYGHPAGDQVLGRVASILKDTCREHEAIARYGGEEFAVVLSGADEAGAIEAGERLRRAIEQADWDLRPMTVSVGVATDDSMIGAPTVLLERADLALYASKQKGRNRVTHYGNLLALPRGAAA